LKPRATARGFVPCYFDCLKEIIFHLVQRFWMTVLEILKRLPEPKDAGSATRAEDNCQRIEFLMAAEVAGCNLGQGDSPTFTFRQI
jgi:hypothetical protein